MNERKKETGVFLSLGLSKFSIFIQHMTELIVIVIPSLLISYVISTKIAQNIGDSVLAQANKSALRSISRMGQIGADIESSTILRTLDTLQVNISASAFTIAGICTLAVIMICVFISSTPMLRTVPRQLLGTHS
nr:MULTISPECIES: FtsX-like permease family protein [unclassified Schaalia]